MSSHDDGLGVRMRDRAARRTTGLVAGGFAAIAVLGAGAALSPTGSTAAYTRAPIANVLIADEPTGGVRVHALPARPGACGTRHTLTATESAVAVVLEMTAEPPTGGAHTCELTSPSTTLRRPLGGRALIDAFDNTRVNHYAEPRIPAEATRHRARSTPNSRRASPHGHGRSFS